MDDEKRLAESPDEESPLLDFAVMLARRKWLVLGLPTVAGLLALAVTFLLPNWYTATAKILPPQQAQSNAVAILGQLGVISGGASQALGLKNPSDTYVAMLKSRTVADRLVERFDLRKIYGRKRLVDARKDLARHSSIVASRDGVITIEVDDQDPARSARVANAYIDELRGLTVHLAVSEAGQRRLFFENQLDKAKGDLTAAEAELKKFTMASGLVNPQGQIGLSVAAAAALRAQIAAKEIQLASMRTFATENNPDLKRTLQELSGLRTELAKMEKDTNAGKGDVMVPFGKAPEVGLDYIRLFRDMKYHETLFEVLSKQYEIARIDEAKDATLIQVLDAALPPEQRSAPRRRVIVLVTAFLALLASIAVALALGLYRRAAEDPRTALRLRELRDLLVGRGAR